MPKRKIAQKSLRTLQKFHRKLKRNGIKAKLRHSDGSNYLHIESVRLPTDIDAAVTPDYQIELAIPYRRYTSSPDAAIDIIFALAKERTA